ncbi:nuclear transport factor 2 family protein [Kibdelosporangium philippinense]|uniref:Nuclear transport factor 2 family protein n=1 Tax=Kibdelosporangium philippinense TaxID=211113 RepID=A0ABS8ZHB1_9PSEU|nr:nuclear transport factor 2 family protein [Kibdelosporangium philippinense]MCE7005217.1 nuclear transport factor 2 family protein [Kibdelosporangium philippinense]
MTAVSWQATETEHPARDASRKSMSAVSRGAKEEWVALFAPDAVIEDPVGQSPIDPTGLGHHGHEAIRAFWDKTVATVERFEFNVVDSFTGGNEVANIGTIHVYLPGDMRMDTQGVFVYRVGDDGLIVSLRAFWEMDRALGTLRKANGSST